MNSTHPERPWQLAPVSRFGRLVATMLCALSLDSAITWSSFSVVWAVPILVVVALVVAIRVARGLDQSIATAISMFVAGAAFALGRFAHGHVSALATVALTIVGVVAATFEVRHHRRQATIRLSRTNRDGPEPVVVRH